MNLKIFCTTLLLVSPLSFSHATAADNLSEASGTLSVATLSLLGMSTHALIEGSAEMLEDVSQLTVRGVEASGTSTVLVLEGMSQAGAVALRVTTQLSGGVLVVAGETVQISTQTLGFVISKAGQVLAFIPNTVGRSLLHSSVHGQATGQ